MLAMVLDRPGSQLQMREFPAPEPGEGQIRVHVMACGVCRTDLHVVDGELPNPKLPIVPGHEIVGRVEKLGTGVKDFRVGDRVGISWLAKTCGRCSYCVRGQENLCDGALFTGYTADGGYATHAIAYSSFALKMDITGSDPDITPLLCAGLIGWRSLKKAGDGKVIGLYGFGAAAHLVAQVAKAQGRKVFAFVRPGDQMAKSFARELGVDWAGSSNETAPESLDAAIIYAPVGGLVPAALKAVRKGGRVICAGIHMSDIPSFPYSSLWHEREIASVANLTRSDGMEFLSMVTRLHLEAKIVPYPLACANDALADLRAGRLQGAAVIIP